MTAFWWGDTVNPTQANYDGNYRYNEGAGGKYRERTEPVDAFNSNAFGLYQVHGNVWEWCQDAWHKNYEGAPADGLAWEANKSEKRVLRGGAWFNIPRSVRSAFRNWHPPDFRSLDAGFRLARTLTLSVR